MILYILVILQLIFDYINRNLPDDLYKLFDYSDNVHDHRIRSVMKKGIFIPSINTTTFGNKSLRYASPVIYMKNHVYHLKDFKKLYKRHLNGTYRFLIRNSEMCVSKSTKIVIKTHIFQHFEPRILFF